MSILSVKLLSALVILIIAILAGAYPFMKRIKTEKGFDFPIGEALASGVFLGAGLLHMLSDAAIGFGELGCEYPFAFLIAGMMFLFLLWLEHLGRDYYEHQGNHGTAFAVLAIIMLSIHSLLEGAALGLSDHLTLLIMIFVAILAHKWAASFSLAVQINKSSFPAKLGILGFLIFAFMSPLGVILGSSLTASVEHFPLLVPIFTALAAGTFLYLGTLHGLARAVMVNKCCNLKHFTFVLIGFAIMAIVAMWT